MFPAVFFHIEEAHQWFFRPGLSILVKSPGLRIFAYLSLVTLYFVGGAMPSAEFQNFEERRYRQEPFRVDFEKLLSRKLGNKDYEYST